MFDHLPVATVARMESDVETLVNVTHLKKSRVCRSNILRMIQGTLDLAVRRHVIPGHQVVAIDLRTYRPTAEEWAAANAPWVFVTDEQARMLADGTELRAHSPTGGDPQSPCPPAGPIGR